MRAKFNQTAGWLILLAVAVASAAIIFIPAYLIQPFKPQTERGVQISFFLKSWSPLLTAAAVLISLALGVSLWRGARRWYGKALLIPPLAVVLICAWLARQNHFEWMFNPLSQSAYARASEVDYIADDDMVLAVRINGESAAYPVRLIAYHHIVQDVVGGTPITATY